MTGVQTCALPILKKLGWKQGDYFRLVECSDGRLRLAKVDELEEFLLKGVQGE